MKRTYPSFFNGANDAPTHYSPGSFVSRARAPAAPNLGSSGSSHHSPTSSNSDVEGILESLGEPYSFMKRLYDDSEKKTSSESSQCLQNPLTSSESLGAPIEPVSRYRGTREDWEVFSEFIVWDPRRFTIEEPQNQMTLDSGAKFNGLTSSRKTSWAQNPTFNNQKTWTSTSSEPFNPLLRCSKCFQRLPVINASTSSEVFRSFNQKPWMSLQNSTFKNRTSSGAHIFKKLTSSEPSNLMFKYSKTSSRRPHLQNHNFNTLTSSEPFDLLKTCTIPKIVTKEPDRPLQTSSIFGKYKEIYSRGVHVENQFGVKPRKPRGKERVPSFAEVAAMENRLREGLEKRKQREQ